MDIDKKGILRCSYYSECSIADGLVGWWPLNGSGIDLCGDSDGIVSGAVITQGFNQLCYSFDGVNDYIQISKNYVYSNGFSISGWINPNTYGGATYGRVIDKTTSTSTTNGFFIYMPTAPQIRFELNGLGITSGNSTIPYSIWTHFCTTVDSSGNAKIYINAVQNTAGTCGLPSTITTTNPLTIGNRSTAVDRTFDGKMQDIRIYNRVLSATEIEILYKTTGGSNTKMEVSNGKVYLTGLLKEV